MRTFSLSRQISAAAALVWGFLFASGAAQAALEENCRQPSALEAAFYSTPQLNPYVISPKNGLCYQNDHYITSHDGVRLHANVVYPANAASGHKFPTIVFIGGWSLSDRINYMGMQQRMARKGYLTVAYTARGFNRSGGEANVAAPADVKDVSSVIDWALANTPADARRLGVAGVSYGASLGIMAAGQDARIGAVASFGGWGRLEDEMYVNDSAANQQWIYLLLGLVYATGKPAQELKDNTSILLNPNSTQAQALISRRWSEARSTLQAVPAINARRVPVFFSKEWQDDLFTPNSTLLMYSQITAPKKMMISPGTHAQSVFAGLLMDVNNDVTDTAIAWFDRYLLGINNGVEQGPNITLKPQTGGAKENLSSWPARELKTLTYQLNPRGARKLDMSCFCYRGEKGSLSISAGAAGSDVINNQMDTVASSEVLPLFSPATEGFGLKTSTWMPAIARDNGIRFEGPVLTRPLKIRGIPRVTLRAASSQTRGMLVGYLYMVDAFGKGTVITHGVKSVRWNVPAGQATDFSFDMTAAAWDVPAGYKLALVFDTKDPLYGDVTNPGEYFAMKLLTGGGQANISIPVR